MSFDRPIAENPSFRPDRADAGLFRKVPPVGPLTIPSYNASDLRAGRPLRIAGAASPESYMTPGNVILTRSDALFNWARSSSLWYLTFGLACCGIEFMSMVGAHYDTERFGMIPRATPRQADVMVVAGWVSKKIVPVVRTLWDQMPEPKYCISMGSCANTGGIHSDALVILNGVNHIIPVHVYVPGCPPRPEVLLQGFLSLQRRIRKGPAPSRVHVELPLPRTR